MTVTSPVTPTSKYCTTNLFDTKPVKKSKDQPGWPSQNHVVLSALSKKNDFFLRAAPPSKRGGSGGHIQKFGWGGGLYNIWPNSTVTDNSREKILSGVRPKTISSKQVIGTDSSAIESLQPVKIVNPVLNQSVGRGVCPISVTMLLVFYKQLEVASQIS